MRGAESRKLAGCWEGVPMPVNKLPKGISDAVPSPPPATEAQGGTPSPSPSLSPLEKEAERDRELALSDAEWKNLWDATEVIDMDTF